MNELFIMVGLFSEAFTLDYFKLFTFKFEIFDYILILFDEAEFIYFGWVAFEEII